MPFQVAIYFNRFYTMLWFVSNLALFYYKSQAFPYPAFSFVVEVLMVFAFFGLDLVRFSISSYANRQLKWVGMIFALIMSLGAFLAYFYFFALQVYVLFLDRWLNIFQFMFIIVEGIFGVLAAILFFIMEKY